jgi:Sulfotransferase family
MPAEPVFILAPPRSFTSVTCGMLGQHPEMYGLPEVHLFVGETLQEVWGYYSQPGRRFGRAGLLRAVAQLHSGEQTVQTVMLAKRWVHRRLPCDTGDVFGELVDLADGAVLVDKSPITVERGEYLTRIRRAFPDARYIHLLRHPRGVGESVVSTFGDSPLEVRGFVDYSTDPPTPDPQKMWLALHTNILAFLDGVPEEQQYTLRGEDLMAKPEDHLRDIADWLGLRTDDDAVEEMLHPENSPFASFGPVNAMLGGDPKFMSDPVLKPGRVREHNLDDPLSWREDGRGFSAEVKELARKFGYH